LLFSHSAFIVHFKINQGKTGQQLATIRPAFLLYLLLFVGKHLIFAMKKIFFLIALVLLSAPAQAWWFGNYDDCVLDNMKAGLSTAGVYAVQRACRNKYPLEPVPDETATPTSQEEVYDFGGLGHRGGKPYFSEPVKPAQAQ
jgi:hypothetical protein